MCIKGLKCINIECLTFKMIFSGIVNCLIITKKNWKFNENIDLEQIPKFSRFLLDHLRNSTKYSYLLSRFQYLVYTNDSIHRFYGSTITMHQLLLALTIVLASYRSRIGKELSGNAISRQSQGNWLNADLGAFEAPFMGLQHVTLTYWPFRVRDHSVDSRKSTGD